MLSAFAKILPEATVFPNYTAEKLYSRFVKGVGWSKFLGRVIRFHRAHFVFIPSGASSSAKQGAETLNGVWAHRQSVFDNLQDGPKSFCLSSVMRRGIVPLPKDSIPFSGRFCGHCADLDSNDSMGEQGNLWNAKLSLRFFVPLLVWSYSQFKESLALLDALIAQRQEQSASNSSSADPTPNLKAEIDYSTVFLHGTAVDLRCRLAQRINVKRSPASHDTVGTEDVALDTRNQNNDSSNVVLPAKAGKEAHPLNDLLNERSTFLSSFNLIRKCLMILTNDTLLNILLDNVTLVENNDSQSEGSVDTTSPIDTPHRFDEVEEEKRLATIVMVLRGCDADYDSNKQELVATEDEFDCFISTALHGSSFCEDYAILLYLLDKLNPIGDGASDSV